jgi:hypothetical protein
LTRLVLYSILLHAIAFYEAYLADPTWGDFFYSSLANSIGLWTIWVVSGNIASDLLSIFMVRYWLRISGQTPILAMSGAILVGAPVILMIYNLRIALLTWWFTPRTLPPVFYLDTPFGDVTFRQIMMILPALAMYVWMPVLAFSLFFAKALVWVAAAAHWMQWFIKQGRNHPLEAIGYIAAVGVFVIVSLLRLLIWIKTV